MPHRAPPGWPHRWQRWPWQCGSPPRSDRAREGRAEDGDGQQCRPVAHSRKIGPPVAPPGGPRSPAPCHPATLPRVATGGPSRCTRGSPRVQGRGQGRGQGAIPGGQRGRECPIHGDHGHDPPTGAGQGGTEGRGPPGESALSMGILSDRVPNRGGHNGRYGRSPYQW